MLSVDLSTDEEESLREMIAGMLSELRMEIADTDRLDYRDMLRARKGILQRVLDGIDVARTTPNNPALPA